MAVVFGWVVVATVTAGPTSRYVSLLGSDSGDGTADSPFRYLQKCIDASGRGDTCVIAGGVYDTDGDVTTVPLNAEVTIAGSGGATDGGPTVLDGSVAAPSVWTKAAAASGEGRGGECVWQSAPLPTGAAVPTQLWVDWGGSAAELVPLTPARFPNAKLRDDSVFTAAGPTGSMLYSAKTSTFGELVDDGTHQPSLADSGIDVTGMVAAIPLGTMGDDLQGVRVTKHAPGLDRFSYTALPGSKMSLHPNVPYFFEGNCGLLDSEDEWCVTRGGAGEAPRLKVWLPGCADPNTQHLRMKRRAFALNMTRGAVTLRNVTLRAAAFAASGTALMLDSVNLSFPTSSGRGGGVAGAAQVTLVDINPQSTGSFSMYNSRMEWADSGCPLNGLGSGPRIINCEFLRSGYGGGSCAVAGDSKSNALTFMYNTVHYFNSFTAVVPGERSTVALNDIGYQGAISDGALVHVHIGPQNGTVIRRNWLHDAQVKASRFDRVNQPGASWGHNGTVVENVAWATGGIMVKGDDHNVRNNTSFESIPPGQATLTVMEYNPSIKWSAKGENVNTQFYDNAADIFYNVSGRLAGHNGGNYAGDIASQVQSVDHRDFRPKPGTPLAASGAGAYAIDEDLWVPGRQPLPVPVPRGPVRQD